MKLEKGHLIIALFTVLYIFAYSIYYLSIRNYEFLWYIFVMIFFFGLVLSTVKETGFDYAILWGLSIWGLLHMSGGGLIVNGDVLYNLQIVHLFDVGDTYVLKFDQFVHVFGFFITALVAFHLIKREVKGKPNWPMVYVASALISMGLGALNEMIEFIATITIKQVNVGGYYNTLLDLISNSIGALLAIFVMRLRKKVK